MTKKTLEELQEIARRAIQRALEDYLIPEEYRSDLVLGTLFEGEDRVFELYLPGARPSDAVVISSARVRANGECTVTVTNLEKRLRGSPPTEK